MHKKSKADRQSNFARRTLRDILRKEAAPSKTEKPTTEQRLAANKVRRDAQRAIREDKKVKTLVNEDRKRAAARPDAIATVSAAYILQCAARRAEKATAKAERKANATTPAEAASNASAN